MNGNKAPNPIDANGDGDYDKSMDARITRLESRSEKTLQYLYEVKTDVAIIKSNYVRREDLMSLDVRISTFETRLLRAMNEQSWRLVKFVCGFGTGLVAATFFIAKNIH